MKIKCVWEHNGNSSLLYAADFPGAYTRGISKEIATKKMNDEICSFLSWQNKPIPVTFEIEIAGEKESTLNISDADSDVIFDNEKQILSYEEYLELKDLAMKSANDFQALYDSVPDIDRSCLPFRRTFYGDVPRTARQMYEHTKNVNAYYFAEINIDADNEGTIIDCRRRGFEKLEQTPGFLDSTVMLGSYDEEWSMRKVMRRFIWHDRIHAKAMYRMAKNTFGENLVPNVFRFKV